MWHESNLTPKDFAEWFEKERLERLYFPVGSCLEPISTNFDVCPIVDFFIHMKDLYELMVDWRINKRNVPLDEIVAVIAFGSTVGPSQRTVEKTRKKYWLFGEEIKYYKTYDVHPNDADFLVITKNKMIDEKVLKAVSITTYDCGTWVIEGGIHLVNRSVSQVIDGVNAGDTISISALKKGVPLLMTPDFAGLITQLPTSILEEEKTNKVRWKTNDYGYLIGRISRL